MRNPSIVNATLWLIGLRDFLLLFSEAALISAALLSLGLAMANHYDPTNWVLLRKLSVSHLCNF